MNFELQLSSDVLTRIVRNRLKALPLCVDREFVDTDGKLTGISGAGVVVDRIEIGENTTIQREQVQHTANGLQSFVPGATQVVWIFWPTNYTSFTLPFLQVKQEVWIHLVKASDLEANGSSPTAPFRSLQLHLVFNVALKADNQTQGGGPLTLSYSLAYIDYGLLYGFLPAQQRADIETYIAGITLLPTSLDLGALASMLKRPVSGINAGIVCDPSNGFVAMRVDFDVYNSPYECNEVVSADMQLTPPYNSRLDIERVGGIPRGLVFGGGITNLREFFMGSLEPVVLCPFKWQVLGRCTDNGKSNFHVGNQGSIHVYGTPPAGMCDARILYDPEGEFAMSINDGVITIVPRFKPSYMASPYPCRVRVITNRGVRTITLHPAVTKTAAEAKKLDEARLAAHMGCYYWEKMFTPIEKVKWLPDPAPFERDRFAQFWQIAVRGLQQEDSIRVATHRGTTRMTVNPSRSGVAHFALLFTDDHAQPELELELRGRREEGGEQQREISLQQVMFEHRASIPVGGSVRSMRFEGGAQSQRLVVVQEDREVTWDLANPVAPALLQSLSMSRQNEQKEIRQDLVVHTGKRIGAVPGPNFLRALGGLAK